MAVALIVTDSTEEAFHTQQILDGFFDCVRACNTLESAKRQMSGLTPDLMIVFRLGDAGNQALLDLSRIGGRETPILLMRSGLHIVDEAEPKCLVRAAPPLNRLNLVKALNSLGLAEIVNHTSLPDHGR